MNFPFIGGDVPHSTSYGVYISLLIRFGRMTSHVDNFNTCNVVLIAKQTSCSEFSIFFLRHFDLVSKYNC